jgi:hypothetical protein
MGTRRVDKTGRDSQRLASVVVDRNASDLLPIFETIEERLQFGSGVILDKRLGRLRQGLRQHHRVALQASVEIARMGTHLEPRDHQRDRRHARDEREAQA